MKTFKRIYLGLIIIFCYAPILSLVIFSFNSTKSLTNWTGFSMQWYQELLTDRVFIEAIIITIVVAIIATGISTIIGTLAAIGLSKSRKVFRDFVMYFTNIPIVNPEIVTAVSLMMFFVAFTLELGLVSMIVAHISFCTPYVIIAVYPKVRSLDPNIVEAAQDLGATPFEALVKVMIPQLTTAIFAGASIAFTMSFDDFVISYFTAGPISNISIYLYTAKRLTPIANAFSTILVVILAAFIIYRLSLNKRKFSEEE